MFVFALEWVGVDFSWCVVWLCVICGIFSFFFCFCFLLVVVDFYGCLVRFFR